jgi:pimeloyl-ACP methyl ester carboxylesterase
MTRSARTAATGSLILCMAAAGDAGRRCEVVCVADEHYEGMLARHKYVLVGRVEDRRETRTELEFHVKAIRVWKGDTRTITLKNTGSGGACGMVLVMGQAYVIFAMENPADLDPCSPVIATSQERGVKAIARLDRARGLPPLALQAVDLPPARAIEGPRYVSVPAGRNRTVQGSEYGEGNHAVVLAPGARFDRWSWHRQASALADAGFRVLAIDFLPSSRAENRAPVTSAETQSYLDVLASVRYLRKAGAQTVSVVGAGFGGGAAAQAAIEAAPGEIDRLVLLTPASIADPGRLKGAKLFVTTRDEARAEGSTSLVEIREQYEKAPEPKQLLVLKGSAHGQFAFTTDQGDRLMKEMLRFLSEPY